MFWSTRRRNSRPRSSASGADSPVVISNSRNMASWASTKTPFVSQRVLSASVKRCVRATIVLTSRLVAVLERGPPAESAGEPMDLSGCTATIVAANKIKKPSRHPHGPAQGADPRVYNLKLISDFFSD